MSDAASVNAGVEVAGTVVSMTVHHLHAARPATEPWRRGTLPEHLRPVGRAPAAGPVTTSARSALRARLVETYGEFPLLDAHLDLLDARGAWYADRAVASWSAGQPDTLFGVIRHVVRTQLDGPTPDPDIEGWLAAGRPTRPEVAQVWDEIRSRRYLTRTGQPARVRPPSVLASVRRVDQIVSDWPASRMDTFILVYAALEHVLEHRFTMPPIDA